MAIELIKDPLYPVQSMLLARHHVDIVTGTATDVRRATPLPICSIPSFSPPSTAGPFGRLSSRRLGVDHSGVLVTVCRLLCGTAFSDVCLPEANTLTWWSHSIRPGRGWGRGRWRAAHQSTNRRAFDTPVAAVSSQRVASVRPSVSLTPTRGDGNFAELCRRVPLAPCRLVHPTLPSGSDRSSLVILWLRRWRKKQFYRAAGRKSSSSRRHEAAWNYIALSVVLLLIDCLSVFWPRRAQWIVCLDAIVVVVVSLSRRQSGKNHTKRGAAVTPAQRGPTGLTADSSVLLSSAPEIDVIYVKAVAKMSEIRIRRTDRRQTHIHTDRWPRKLCLTKWRKETGRERLAGCWSDRVMIEYSLVTLICFARFEIGCNTFLMYSCECWLPPRHPTP